VHQSSHVHPPQSKAGRHEPLEGETLGGSASKNKPGHARAGILHYR
jgi:hypothetical protein